MLLNSLRIGLLSFFALSMLQAHAGDREQSFQKFYQEISKETTIVDMQIASNEGLFNEPKATNLHLALAKWRKELELSSHSWNMLEFPEVVVRWQYHETFGPNERDYADALREDIGRVRKLWDPNTQETKDLGAKLDATKSSLQFLNWYIKRHKIADAPDFAVLIFDAIQDFKFDLVSRIKPSIEDENFQEVATPLAWHLSFIQVEADKLFERFLTYEPTAELHERVSKALNQDCAKFLN